MKERKPWSCVVHTYGKRYRLTGADGSYRWDYLGCSFTDWNEEWGWHDSPNAELARAVVKHYQRLLDLMKVPEEEPGFWDRWPWLILRVLLVVDAAFIVWVLLRIL